jgi:hypothetical protein
MGIHRETKQFYIGSRTSKKLKSPPEQDILKYRTSSKIVKPIFDEFDWFIIAMFFGGNDAYAFEQEWIYENWNNPLILNKVCHYDMTMFSTYGIPMADETKLKISSKNKGKVSPNKGKPMPEHQRILMKSIHTGKHVSDETKLKISVSNTGKIPDATVRTKLSLSKIGENNPNFGRSTNNLSKFWEIILPSGEIIVIKNMNKFCKENNLNASRMGLIAKGLAKTHKGYRCKKLN